MKTFEIWSDQVKICQIPYVNFETKKLIPLQISCGDMGRGDVTHHCDPKGETVHNNNVKSIKKSARIKQFPVSTAPTKDQATINAEVLHTNVIVQHNLLFAIADPLSDVINLLCW